MPAERSARLTRWFLFGLIGSIAFGAILGIIVILAGNWSWFEVRVLLTAGVIAAASVCGLACGASLGRGHSLAVPAIGIVLTILGATLLVGGMWLDVSSVEYWKTAVSVSVLAVACAHVALLSMARLADTYRWAQGLAYVIVFLVALTIVLITVSGQVDEGTWQWLAVIAILDAAFTTMVPIFHLLSRERLAGTAESVAAEAPSGAASLDREAIDAEIARLRERIEELERARIGLP